MLGKSWGVTSSFVYHTDIDGLRAIAVILVIFFHLNVQFFSGGYVGVDVFFVISGFLITQLIKNELSKTHTFSFTNFYIRRTRRLLPALFVTLTLTLFIGALLFSQTHMQLMGETAVAALLFGANFMFWSQSGYFDIDALFKPLLHTWSLGIEEQFYFFWPLFLVFILKLTSKRVSVLLFIIVFIVSLGLNPLFSGGYIPTFLEKFPSLIQYFKNAPATLFFLPFFRFFEFMIGAALVWIPKHRIKYTLFLECAVCIGFILLFYAVFSFTDKTLFPSFNALYPCLGAAFIIWGGKAPVIGYFLRNRLVVWIGKRSYSLYLIHWPLIVFFHYWTFRPLSCSEQVSIFFTAILLSDVMFRFVETPFRGVSQTACISPTKPFLARAIIWFTLLTSISLVSFEQSGLAWRIPETRRMLSEDAYRAAETAFCSGKENSTSLITCSHSVGSDKNIYLWGDSHSRHLIPGFAKVYPNHNIHVLYLSSCMPQSGLFGYYYDFEGRVADAQECVERNRKAIEYFKASKPTHIVIQYFHRVDDIKNKKLIDATLQLSQILISFGHKVKVISDVIRPGKPLTECLAVPFVYSDQKLKLRCHGDNKLAYKLRAEDAILAERLGPSLFVNMSSAFCEKNNCVSFLNAKPLFRDDHHLTIAGSEYFVTQTKKYLDIQG